ncbi:SRPBCC family protein [Methanomethylovorans sp.]|uniref:SRPBCC family protein n=1 Tax=Methanomethylovorans sp. TaxID=2758717 RepID=UPI00351C4D8C
MRRICTTVNIEASSQDVWEILADLNEYQTWNPFIVRVFGKPQPGEKLDVRLKVASLSFDLKPMVLIAEINREIRWRGYFLVKGLFDGEHLFRIEEMEDGSVHFINCEKFTGVLVPLFMYLIKKDTENGFNAMNEQLKKMAEKRKANRES